MKEIKPIKRIFLIVVDSMGCGYMPDAESFGDTGACTLNTIRKSENWDCPNLEALGIFFIDGFKEGETYYLPDKPGTVQGTELKEGLGELYRGAYGRLMERSAGKDTTAGHWEIAGLVTKHRFPVFPEGFPEEIIREFERRTGKRALCNRPYSGTEVIKDFGAEHMRTGDLIVYTSADSVFQIAANESVVSPEELYGYCRIAREILTGEKYGVGRVIARPFTGSSPEDFVRDNAKRHDFSLCPPGDTMLDILKANGFSSIGIGKIRDIFAGKGLDESFTTPTVSNEDGMDRTIGLLKEDFKGLVFVNLVETDSVYGHRRDIDGYAKAVSRFDQRLGELISGMSEDDLVMITADHGCDPGFKGTDHTREYIPFLAYGKRINNNTDIGTRNCFGDIAATILDIFGISNDNIDGESFKDLIISRGGA